MTTHGIAHCPALRQHDLRLTQRATSFFRLVLPSRSTPHSRSRLRYSMGHSEADSPIVPSAPALAAAAGKSAVPTRVMPLHMMGASIPRNWVSLVFVHASCPRSSWPSWSNNQSVQGKRFITSSAEQLHTDDWKRRYGAVCAASRIASSSAVTTPSPFVSLFLKSGAGPSIISLFRILPSPSASN